MKKLFALIFVTLLGGCASSYHNIDLEGESALGGGFRDKKIAEGMYKIMAKTNFAPWLNYSAAHKTFNRRAKELCDGDYQILRTTESQSEHMETEGLAKYIISKVDGYVLCENTLTSKEEAKRLLKLEY
ncbi:hypothetical protein CWB73_01145 [Pseudoalteromonas phenolica]|uniref:Lipoprotein n=1 Tax=Pseudoalteromonas phenolica TaxID=161398 RepID=A0A5S3YZR0_9GAMM|nr:hypothetical protein [Pseudoalteromonas phenolica]TMN89511.1 hypothetical protein CWB72_10775 [Pseudoalteromonas phenolica]TMP83785.1 hypothetical protein CWB73_01145 [Pseudoalteromonas phenolica]